jgi:hypothetical protein
MKVVSLKEKAQDNTTWPVDRLLERIGDFDEVLILAKTKGQDRYTRFSSQLKSTFWWIGVLEAMKRNLMEESLEHDYDIL